MQQRVIQALRQAEYGKALDLSREWVAQSPTSVDAQRLLAVSLQHHGAHDEAAKVLDAAIAMAPNDAELHFLRAGLSLQTGAAVEAVAALDRSVALNPNHFPAYLAKAQLALAAQDTDEAQRVLTLAERVDPAHPQLLTLWGMLAMQRNDADTAIKHLTAASKHLPDHPQLLHALGFAYMAKGHLAFAEQAFRRLLAIDGAASPGLHMQLAEVLQAQGRPDEALQQLKPQLDKAQVPAPMLRYAGELALQLGQFDQATTWLTDAVRAMPGEPRTLMAAVEGWWRAQQLDKAKPVLDALLAEHTDMVALWRARIHVAELLGEDIDDVLQAWMTEAPDTIAALEMRMGLQATNGMRREADATAEHILKLQPGHARAHLHLISGLLKNDPDAALAHIDGLLEKAAGDDNRRLIEQWKAGALESAGRFTDAAAHWLALHRELTNLRPPLPPVTTGLEQLPRVEAAGEDGKRVAFVFGLPGGGLEKLLPALHEWFAVFRSDRFGGSPPHDPLQYLDTPAQLVSGAIKPDVAFNAWQNALPARGITHGSVIDWLPWWDNALLLAVAPHLPGARLLYALRDPRDMLLNWLRGNVSGVPFALPAPVDAAKWLADALQQLLDLREQNAMDVRMLKLDESHAELAREVLGQALDVDVSQMPPPNTAPDVTAPSQWRDYADVLREPFAVLTPVAVALGYPEH